MIERAHLLSAERAKHCDYAFLHRATTLRLRLMPFTMQVDGIDTYDVFYYTLRQRAALSVQSDAAAAAAAPLVRIEHAHAHARTQRTVSCRRVVGLSTCCVPACDARETSADTIHCADDGINWIRVRASAGAHRKVVYACSVVRSSCSWSAEISLITY